MEIVIRAQGPAIVRRANSGYQMPQIFQPARLASVPCTNGKTVEYSCHTTCYTDTIMGNCGGDRIPSNIGAGEIMALQIISVDVDNPGYQIVAIKINRATVSKAVVDPCDNTIFDNSRTMNDLVGKNNPGI
jgi:hypothetical protein